MFDFTQRDRVIADPHRRRILSAAAAELPVQEAEDSHQQDGAVRCGSRSG
jgi:hypothetical protein